MWLIFLLITIYSNFSNSLDSDVGGLVKPTVSGNEAVLYNCSKEQDLILQQCYLDMFQKYGMNYSTLPESDEDPFKMIRYDSSGMCGSYSNLEKCHAEIFSDCLNYNTFYYLLNSETGAEYYVAQTAFLDFYCNHGLEFINYYQCMQTIEMNDLSDTIFTECSVLEVGSCDSVSRTIQCERAVVRRTCSTASSIKSYCTYQKILTHMTGWDQCEYMPCINSSIFHFSTSGFLILFLVFLMMIS